MKPESAAAHLLRLALILKPSALARIAIATAVGVALSSRGHALTYDFNDGTLQGWHNRVWNGSAWTDLAANVTTYSPLLPTSTYNGLFVPGSNAVWVSGNTDAHLNTLWLRSPEFYLAPSGDLTVQLAQGVSHATWAAPMNDAAVPYTATNGGGWMGVALRTVNNNQFVLVKPKTSGGSGTWYTTTFTQAELAPYVGVVCTLDLINADNGGWGWITMDNVFIPGDTSPPGQGKDILSFTFPTYGAATITDTNISLTVPYGTDVTALAPTYALSYGATCDKPSGSTQNFSSPVHYIVTAGNSTTKDYTVTVNITPASTAKDILTFGPGATISGTNITWTVPYGTDVSNLSPTYTISALATAAPAGGSVRNFTTPRTYTVTAQDLSTKTYTVTVNITPASSAKNILTMYPGGVITGTNISIYVPYGTDLTTVAPTYTLSPFATATPFTGTTLDFRTPQTYTVTAQDGSSQNYTVTASVLPDAPSAINVALGGVRSIGRNNLMNGTLSYDGSQGAGNQAGPAAYGGTTWNDVSGIAASQTHLLDSKGVSTAVGFSLNSGGYKDARNEWAGTGRLRLFGAGCHADNGNSGGWQPDANTLPTLTLTGLDATHKYDLYLVGDDVSTSVNQYNIGGTFNFTTRVFTGGSTMTATQNPENAGTWVEGRSYVKFPGLTGSTSIAVQDNATSGRYILNGFQLVDTTPQANITAFTFPGYGAATISGTSINITVPYGTNVSALAPTYAISYGASCVPASGAIRDFTSPVHYVVTASDHSTTKDYAVTATVRPIADPAFTLTAPAGWDGRQTITVQATITNQALLQATGGTNVNYNWSVAGVAVTKQITPGTLTLTRSQGSGPMTVTLVMDNGGWAASHSVTVNVQQPANDAWVQRSPGATEKPVTGQFFARDDTGKGTIYYNGTVTGTPDSVYLKVFKTPNNGADILDSTTTMSKPFPGGLYALSAKIDAGLATYRVEFGTTTGATNTLIDNSVTNLVCGDAYIIEGQSNAEATAPGVDTTAYSSPWIRTYAGGWGNAVRQGTNWIGYWGMDLAIQLLTDYQMPICIINGAVGGTRIDQHQPNPVDHSQAGSGNVYSIYANLYNRVVAARLTHGIRAVLWHQGEQDQGTGGPYAGDYDYKYYQQAFVDMSAAWKQDYPNIRNYFIYQIWPNACGDTSANDLLRDTQRTLPYLFSNMRIMSTLGVVPGSSCHYDPTGYQNMADLMSPLVEQDIYGYMPGTVFTAPDLKQAYFTTEARNEIALEFGQDISWNPGAPGLFFLDGLAGKVTWGSASGKVIKLQLTAPSTAKTITYLQGADWAAAGSVQANLLYGTNGRASLTFANVPIGTATTVSYASWISTKSLSGAAAAGDADPDHDGIMNALEYVLGGEPNPPATGAYSAALLPHSTTNSAGDLIFTFQRKIASVGGVNLSFQWTTGLTFPVANAVPIGAASSTTGGIDVAITKYDATTDTIVITVPAAKAAGGKLFGRLQAVVP